MDKWKIQLVVVTFCALVQTYQRFSFKSVFFYLQDDSLQTSPVASLIKRSKAHRFYGLMGKRSGSRETYRNKGETFVGLMGRSISSGGKHKNIKRPRVNRGYFKISRQLY
uniref:Uncharacterized protein n=1 Tax=Amphilophus citrinellus TaxID=61819 RepID=A0A3Q0QWN3_AMPCI